MGRFVHEAIAVDPNTGWVYQTEDQQPERASTASSRTGPGDLAAGGSLSMLAVVGQPELRHPQRGRRSARSSRSTGSRSPTPTRRTPRATRLRSTSKVRRSVAPRSPGSRARGAANNRIYFHSHERRRPRPRQVWELNRIRQLFERQGTSEPPVRIEGSGGARRARQHHRQPARRSRALRGRRRRPVPARPHPPRARSSTSRSTSTRASPTRSSRARPTRPDGETLFVNIQTPGVTLAIWGPWEDGAL